MRYSMIGMLPDQRPMITGSLTRLLDSILSPKHLLDTLPVMSIITTDDISIEVPVACFCSQRGSRVIWKLDI
jgi:hypothetical protein